MATPTQYASCHSLFLQCLDMEIIKILLIETIRIIGATADSNYLLHLVNEAKRSGVTHDTIRAFACAGIPLLRIFSNVLRIEPSQAVSFVESGKFTYDDLICAISIFAQDIKREQQLRQLRYGTK